MAAGSKPYGLVMAVPLLAPLVSPLPGLEPRRRGVLLLSFALPFFVWLVAIGWYNWMRHGSVLDFASAPYTATLAAPVNALGQFVSPGKGLLFYSPLALLGLLGIRRVWRSQRSVGLAILGSLMVATAAVSLPPYWTDEFWGPRYLVPVAWLLLLPLPWWATTQTRRRILVGTATLAVTVQLVGVLVPYSTYVRVTPPYNSLSRVQALSGLPYRPFGEANPLGHDTARWVPQLSPLLFQGELLASVLSETVGGPPLTVQYEPYFGVAARIDLRDGDEKFGASVPDLWWRGREATAKLFVLVLTMALVAAAAGLVRSLRANDEGPSPASRSHR